MDICGLSDIGFRGRVILTDLFVGCRHMAHGIHGALTRHSARSALLRCLRERAYAIWRDLAAYYTTKH